MTETDYMFQEKKEEKDSLALTIVWLYQGL